MSENNFERMINLADEVFAVKNDPNQLDVNEKVIERLQKIHPSTVSEYNEGAGPVAWVLIIPTTYELMLRFIENEISEKELFEMTPLNISYNAIYLCSALVLEEYRRKGIAKKLFLDALEKIRKEHPVKYLFSWPFTKEGDSGSDKIAELTSLPLYKRH
jgi:GNAT superfamily N-acetyltransferase